MRWFVVLLLLGNIFLYAWQYNVHVKDKTRGVMSNPTLPVGTPSLTLMSELDVLPPLRKKSSREEFMADPPDPEMVNSTEVNTEATASDICIRTGPFTQDKQFKTFREWLRPRTKTMASQIETLKKQQFFWVYLESESEDEARDNLAELKRKGVQDYMLVRDGDLKNAISLGLFRSQDSVTRRLAEMSEQGYKVVVVPKYEITQQFWINASLAEGFEDVETVEIELGDGVKLLEVDCNTKAAASL